LNSGEIHDANLKAISECAYVPPYLQVLDIMPIEFVLSIYF